MHLPRPIPPRQIETDTFLICGTVTLVFSFTSAHPSPIHLMPIGPGVLEQDVRSTSCGSRVDASRVNANVPCLTGNGYTVFIFFSPSHCPVGLEFRWGTPIELFRLLVLLTQSMGFFCSRSGCHVMCCRSSSWPNTQWLCAALGPDLKQGDYAAPMLESYAGTQSTPFGRRGFFILAPWGP